jgi:6-phosphogluconolactonase (cycloisomerase 2 family)
MRSHALPLRIACPLLRWYAVVSMAVYVLLLSPPTPVLAASPSRFLAVVNTNSNSVTSFTIQADGSLHQLAFVTTGKRPRSIVFNPCGPFAYVRTQDDFSIDTFDIDGSGRLVKRPPVLIRPTILSDSAKALAIHPRCKSLYVPWYLKAASLPVSPPPKSGIDRFSIDSRGNLSYAAQVEVDSIPVAVESTPNGAFLYAAAQGAAKLTIYTTDTDSGKIKTIVGAVPARVNYPYALAITPDSQHLYVVSKESRAVAMFTINLSTGVPTWLGNILNAGQAPSTIRIHPNGRFAYVVDYGNEGHGGKVQTYAIAGNGTLSLVGEIAAGVHPYAIATNDTGTFAFVADFGTNKVLSFAINALTGGLTPRSSVDAGGLGPFALIPYAP